MNNLSRMLIFLSIFLSLWTLLHGYVLARTLSLSSITSVVSRKGLVGVFVFFWLLYPVIHIFFRRYYPYVFPLDMMGSIWMGWIFLAFVWVFVGDFLTGFGIFSLRLNSFARLGGLGMATVFCLVGFYQALSTPTLRHLKIQVPHLPKDQEGLSLVQISDLHLGSFLGKTWLSKRIDQINQIHPDLVLVTGDVVENLSQGSHFIPEFQKLSARLGVWAVTGNHEYYAGLEASLNFFKQAGFQTLQNEWKEIQPGLLLAGVNDLTVQRQHGIQGDFVQEALAHKPIGTTILLSHTPWEVEKAEQLGVNLMICGHTHGGQIWPFGYFAKLRYPFFEGLYKIKNMSLVVSRGTGFWGPPVRLFYPPEILHIVLTSSKP